MGSFFEGSSGVEGSGVGRTPRWGIFGVYLLRLHGYDADDANLSQDSVESRSNNSICNFAFAAPRRRLLSSGVEK